jgi:hypothetical protein
MARPKAEMKGGSRTFEQLLAAYPPGVQTLARQTRALVLQLLPDVEQTVDAKGPYVCYGRGPGYKGIVCTISVNKTGVKLALAHGATLPDPTGLLEGAGKVHRHVVVTTADDLRQPGLEPLVRATDRAWQKRR